MTRRCTFTPSLLTLLLVPILSGCSTQLPLVSHAHVGHALTTWHDTPGQRGLMEIAAADLAVAEQEARLACRDPSPFTGTGHIRNTINALVPEAMPEGPASGYGAVRALIASIEHLEFAATSADASLNLIAAVAELSIHGEAVHERLKVAVELSQSLLDAPAADWPAYCDQLQRELRVAIRGGIAGPDTGGFPSVGFNALKEGLMAALTREQAPAYAPVARRYVLGLVRLPSGQWEYKLARPGQNALVNYNSYGY